MRLTIKEKMQKLRITATCRCRAINKKLELNIPDIFDGDYKANFGACCWVCCDCHYDRFVDEWGAQE